jgi:chromosome segregation ATPase
VLVAVGAAMLVGALVYKANATKKVDDANLALGRATAELNTAKSDLEQQEQAVATAQASLDEVTGELDTLDGAHQAARASAESAVTAAAEVLTLDQQQDQLARTAASQLLAGQPDAYNATKDQLNQIYLDAAGPYITMILALDATITELTAALQP